MKIYLQILPERFDEVNYAIGPFDKLLSIEDRFMDNSIFALSIQPEKIYFSKDKINIEVIYGFGPGATITRHVPIDIRCFTPESIEKLKRAFDFK